MEGYKPIARAARYIWAVAILPIIAIPAAFAIVISAVTNMAYLVVAVLTTLAVCAWWWWVTGRRWRAWGYVEREKELIIKRGVFVRRVTFIPYGRMQFVELKQGPFDRLINTYEVQLHTAAAATDAKIPLIPADEAHRLRKSLTELGEAHAAGL